MIAWLRRLLATDEQIQEGSCNKYGHDFQHKRVSGYHASGVPHFGFGNSWTVRRKDHYKCSKCGKSDFRRTRVGKVKVDKSTDEMTVIQ